MANVASSNPTPSEWAATVLRALGIHQTPGGVQALTGWARAEGGHWKNDARFNPLNTTQPMPGAGNTGSQGNIKVYKDWQQGVDATVKTLRNGRYGGILHALSSGDPSAVASAIGKTPWGTSGDLVSRSISSTPRVAGVHGFDAGGSAAAASSDAGTPAPSAVPDAAAQSSAGAQALLAQMQQLRQPAASMGVQSPGFSAQAALPSGYQAPVSGGGPQQSSDVSSLLALASQSQGQATQAPAAAPSGQGDVLGASGGSSGQGKVVIAPGAEKPGHGLQKPILGFLHDVSAASGREVDVTTGTNHNEFVAGTNRRSDHADGNAADLGVGGDARRDQAAGRKGDLIAAHAIQVASQRAGEKVDFQHALALARRGGVFNFQTPQGRVQILWRTMTGGNHYNHVHTGLNPGH